MSLRIIRTSQELKSCVSELQAEGKSIGFVPTMGALHAGHISLIQRALSENDVVMSSIFVNPTQFNNPDDLKKYPKREEQDVALLSEAGCDVLFMPEISEMYDADEEKGHWNFGLLSQTLEGHFRPGHFDGVLTIVKKLFLLFQPTRAYFGEKDFQQLAHIKRLVQVEQFPIEIVPCPTLRDADGLAMSSRNLLLSSEERAIALTISKVLFEIKARKESEDPASLEVWGRSVFLATPGIELEYLEIIDGNTFGPLPDWSDSTLPVASCAAYVGKVRLIDNIIL